MLQSILQSRLLRLSSHAVINGVSFKQGISLGTLSQLLRFSSNAKKEVDLASNVLYASPVATKALGDSRE